MSVLLGPHLLQLLLEVLELLLQLAQVALEVLVLLLQLLHVRVRGRAQAFLDVVDRVIRLIRLLVEANQDFSQLVDYARLLKVLAEFFLLLLGGLYKEALVGYS
eukprot:NODE_9059_length_384_cov_34.686567_g8163_i0.p1 GENE.NODE_9059_length_384_cov_34.686567_g8163_i0~~NODE_9059_length_384_cov_34.686567_g8163_i0.p1  ORF type:complete len:104 (-),score=8.97 NODE_9059_length_384_cov_34.686567_g8163_i0:49-360(-)